ncbi:MAG: TRAP transporter small permease subunit [Proteobacteria bacterium]|nr:TRAP transporter small permease subunit [Pseudomonadota bacterium]
MNSAFKVVRFIDGLSLWSGKIFAWLSVPLVGGLVYEVVARYAFNSPTEWAYDITYMLYGIIFMMGAAYTLYNKGHIRTDLLYNTFPARWQGLIDTIFYLFFFFPGMILFLVAGWDYAAHAWDIKETAAYSPWRPIVYPFKTVIPIAIILLIIQGIAEFIKSVYATTRGEWR